MRAVIQRVSKASVRVRDGEVINDIGIGLLILLGVEQGDTEKDIQWLSGKISRLRIFSDVEGNMNHSLNEINGEAMVVSQFTLHASTKKGNRPSFIKAAKPEEAIPLYESFIVQLKKDTSSNIKTGEFGAMMEISLNNDGPVTILMDSRQKE
jgi:D-tyrosyl-tRNA(Tyr) deacylase